MKCTLAPKYKKHRLSVQPSERQTENVSEIKWLSTCIPMHLFLFYTKSKLSATMRLNGLKTKRAYQCNMSIVLFNVRSCSVSLSVGFGVCVFLSMRVSNSLDFLYSFWLQSSFSASFSALILWTMFHSFIHFCYSSFIILCHSYLNGVN